MSKIELKNVTKIYGEPKRKGLLPEGARAVDDVSMIIPDKSFTVLVGPSGCGKTTLLRLIAGLEVITLGNIKIGDVDVTNIEPGNRGIAMVFQTYALYPHMTVWKNVEFGLKNARMPSYEINRRIKEVLKLVNLEEYANRRPANLSGGQRQRVALARAIAKKPQVFLMDEPLSNLDAKLRSSMRTELIQMHENLKSTFVYVTHDQVEAMTMGDNIVVMNEGIIMQVGDPLEIHDEPNCVFVAQFIGDPGMNIITLNNDKKIGFRPRNINFISQDNLLTADDCLIKGNVLAIENHGSEFLYYIDIGLGKIYIKDADRNRKIIGENVEMVLKRKNVYTFDENCNRIYDSKEVSNIYEYFRKSRNKL
ncbi:MAG: ABC transporter ATP-binding protein [Bacilli bacterium]|nr:ABC transporter ATP-binding protein [Bacilli bacterium]